MSAPLLFKPVAENTLSGAPSAVLTLGSNPLYMVGIRELVPSVQYNFSMRLNDEASAYKYHRNNAVSSSSGYAGAASSSSTSVSIASQFGNDTGESYSGSLFIPNASSSSLFKPIWGHSAQVNASGQVKPNDLAAYWSGGLDALTSVKFYSGSATLSGNIDLYELALHGVGMINDTYGPATLLDWQVASGAPYVDLSITGDYARYVVVQLGVVTSNATFVWERVGTAGGVKASGCKLHVNGSTSIASTYSGFGNAAYSAVIVNPTQTGIIAGQNYCRMTELPNPSGQYKAVSSNGATIRQDGSIAMCNGAGAWTGGTDQLTTYRVIAQTGTVSGEFGIYGIGKPA